MSRDKLLPGLPLPFVNCTYVTRDTLGAEPKWVILGGHGGHMILFLAIFLVAMVVYIPDSSNRAWLMWVLSCHITSASPTYSAGDHLFEFTSIEKSQKHSTCEFFILQFISYFFKWRKGKIIPSTQRENKRREKFSWHGIFLTKKSRLSNDETKNNPPSTQKKEELLSYFLFLTRYISPRKVAGKREKTSSYDVDGLKTNYRTTWMWRHQRESPVYSSQHHKTRKRFEIS